MMNARKIWLAGGLIAATLAVALYLPGQREGVGTQTSGLRQAVPTTAPLDFEFTQFTASESLTRTLSELRGKPLLVNFWATWCVSCREEMPALDRLQAQLGGPDFEVVPVSVDRGGPEVVTEFLTEIGTEHIPVYIADMVALRGPIGVFGLPTTLLIDREGREVHRWEGPAEWDSPEMIATMNELLGFSLPSAEVEPGGQSL